MRFTIAKHRSFLSPERLLRMPSRWSSLPEATRAPSRKSPRDVLRGRLPALRPTGRVPAAARGPRPRWAPHLEALQPGARFVGTRRLQPHVDREAASEPGSRCTARTRWRSPASTGRGWCSERLITDVELAPTAADPEAPAWDACGSLPACIDACPTDAILDGGVLDSRSCLSYLSQSRLEQLPSPEAFGDRVYGCDMCQEVCPWNRAPSGGRPPVSRRGRGRVPAARRMAGERRPMRSPSVQRLYVPGRDGRACSETPSGAGRTLSRGDGQQLIDQRRGLGLDAIAQRRRLEHLGVAAVAHDLGDQPLGRAVRDRDDGGVVGGAPRRRGGPPAPSAARLGENRTRAMPTSPPRPVVRSDISGRGWYSSSRSAASLT